MRPSVIPGFLLAAFLATAAQASQAVLLLQSDPGALDGAVSSMRTTCKF